MTAPSAKVIHDSISPAGQRLTTMEVTMHRFVLAEMNTHRAFSRNSASSRAIPVAKRIRQVREDPAMPIEWGRNRPGMSAGETLAEAGTLEAEATWNQARLAAIEAAEKLAGIGVHKQVINRLLEPFLWHTVLVSSTEWDNFFNLRISPDAQPEIRVVAEAMKAALDGSTPIERPVHLPFSDNIESSVAHCARVTYERQSEMAGQDEDARLFSRLRESGHWSPFEHVAVVTRSPYGQANFRGWAQLRWYAERGKVEWFKDRILDA